MNDILIIHNNPAGAVKIAENLSCAGLGDARCFSIAEGYRAIRNAERYLFTARLVVLGAEGYDSAAYGLLWLLRNNRRTKRIPVLLISDSQLANEILRGYNLGADCVLNADFNQSQLRYALSLLLIGLAPSVAERTATAVMSHRQRLNQAREGGSVRF